MNKSRQSFLLSLKSIFILCQQLFSVIYERGFWVNEWKQASFSPPALAEVHDECSSAVTSELVWRPVYRQTFFQLSLWLAHLYWCSMTWPLIIQSNTTFPPNICLIHCTRDEWQCTGHWIGFSSKGNYWLGVFHLSKMRMPPQSDEHSCHL